MSVLIAADAVTVDFATRDGRLRAIDGVSLRIEAGESLGLVGESGSGKSTLGRVLLGLVRPTAGTIAWDGTPLAALPADARRALRGARQIVFQDPLASLDPRLPIGASVAEPLAARERGLGGVALARRVAAMLERVGIEPALAGRYPHEFSGGQCQRIGIARAMISAPRLLVCDEPVSALDASVQGQILNLLLELQREQGTALLFISHNLAVVRRMCPRVLVMYLGRIVEAAPRATLYGAPLHPYTRLLLAATPARLPVVDGSARAMLLAAASRPAPAFAPAAGCAFRERCPRALERCAREIPLLEPASPEHAVACWRWRAGS